MRLGRLVCLGYYLYPILESEARIACLTLGLDPGLGIWHADYRSRDSFALDLMEAVRPDVYWTKEGRSSIEAILMAFAFGVLCLIATAPAGADPSQDIPHSVLGAVVAVNLSFALVAFLKGKTRVGVIGLVIPGVAIVGAVGLARPTSLWARRFYSADKLDRSTARITLQHDRYTRLIHRLYDTIGGAPHLQRPDKPAR